MGISRSVYIGPYIRATETVTKKMRDRCATHGFPADAAYCPRCGTASGSRLYESTSGDAPPGWAEKYHPRGEFYDFLYPANREAEAVKGADGTLQRTILYLPNRFWKELGISRLGESGLTEELPFDSLDPVGVVAKFHRLYEKTLAHLRRWFKVEVRFGLVSYWS